MKPRHTVIPAVYVLFRDGGKVLLLLRANTGYRDGFYSMPAGHFEGGEPAALAAAREAHEEVGVTINPKDLRLLHTQHRLAEEGDHERINLFFEAEEWQGEIRNMEPKKCDDLSWYSVDKLPVNLVPELVELFKHLSDKQPYGDFGF